MEINLNAMAQVKLTRTGYETLIDEFGNLPISGYNSDTHVYVIELWNLFSIFGSKMYNGMPEVPFEGNVIIIDTE